MCLEIWYVFVCRRFIALEASREMQPFVPFLIGTDRIAEFKGLWSCDLFEGRSKGNPTICSLAQLIQFLPGQGNVGLPPPGIFFLSLALSWFKYIAPVPVTSDLSSSTLVRLPREINRHP